MHLVIRLMRVNLVGEIRRLGSNKDQEILGFVCLSIQYSYSYCYYYRYYS